MTRRALGYWRSARAPELPDPVPLVDEVWDEEEQWLVAMYLDRGQLGREFMGFSRCRICQCLNGNAERMDDEFLWPSGLSHYVSEHSVKLPAEFIRHVLRRLDELEEADYDLTWWKEQAHRA
ncbi:hypothetical protein ACIRYZ_36585 [Kitasatospora sp. NPDC101155]|uniref:hypothetical protein n=1 Tax=Kitasatospora sp. NPDC101155 TaxID=3364097 RepID=UPI00380884D8